MCGRGTLNSELSEAIAGSVRKLIASKTDAALAAKGLARSTPSAILGAASCEEQCEIEANADITCLASLSANGVIDSQCFLDGLDNITTNYEACLKACP